MKSRKPKDVNLKPYDMWTDEDYEAAIPKETRKAFDRAANSPKIRELMNKMCSEKNITQEEKELLINDLYARLAYSAQICVLCGGFEYDKTLTYDDVKNYCQLPACSKTIVKLYLRPLSSMTEEEYNELKKISSYYGLAPFEDIHNWTPNYNLIDWLNCKMFDYRGLIGKGFALEAPEGMYNS